MGSSHPPPCIWPDTRTGLAIPTRGDEQAGPADVREPTPPAGREPDLRPQRQFSIELTVDTYRRRLPMGTSQRWTDWTTEVVAERQQKQWASRRTPPKFLKNLVSRGGIEPPTPCLKVSRHGAPRIPQRTYPRKKATIRGR